jgi:hypothetical protein
MIAILTLAYKNIKRSAWIRFLMTFLADLLISYPVTGGLQSSNNPSEGVKKLH